MSANDTTPPLAITFSHPEPRRVAALPVTPEGKVKGCSCRDCRLQFPEAFDARGNLRPGQ